MEQDNTNFSTSDSDSNSKDPLINTLLQNRFKIIGKFSEQGANSYVYSGIDLQNGSEIIFKIMMHQEIN